MLPRSTRPNGASRGRRSNSNGGLFADAAGLIHIRVPPPDIGDRSYVTLYCEKKGGRGAVGPLTAVPARMNTFATCVRCLGMEHA